MDTTVDIQEKPTRGLQLSPEGLRLGDKPSYQNFLRMDEPAFEELLCKVGPLITKQDTPFLAGGCHFCLHNMVSDRSWDL